MELIVLKNNLKEGLGILGKIGMENSSLPVLKNFLLETIDNKIKISATNLEIATTSYIPAKIIKNGEITAPIGVISSIINNIQSERITLETKSNTLLIKTDNYQAKIQGVKKEEFPIIPSISNKKNFIEINSALIKNFFSLVNTAASSSSARAELSGVLFDFQGGLFKLAATDTFRLSEKTAYENQFKSNIDKKFKTIIPQKTIQELIRIIPEKEEEKVQIYFDANQVLFQTEKFELISRVINGEFPDYQNIIPSKITTEVILNKEDLINALKLTSSFSDHLNEIKIIIKENGKNVEIFSANQLLGENQCLIPAKIKGEPMEIVFNWKFLFDGIKNIETSEVFLGMNSNNKPAIIKPVNSDNYFYIVMPIKSS